MNTFRVLREAAVVRAEAVIAERRHSPPRPTGVAVGVHGAARERHEMKRAPQASPSSGAHVYSAEVPFPRPDGDCARLA